MARNVTWQPQTHRNRESCRCTELKLPRLARPHPPGGQLEPIGISEAHLATTKLGYVSIRGHLLALS